MDGEPVPNAHDNQITEPLIVLIKDREYGKAEAVTF